MQQRLSFFFQNDKWDRFRIEYHSAQIWYIMCMEGLYFVCSKYKAYSYMNEISVTWILEKELWE